MFTPVERLASLEIGSVESVAPDHLWVLLDGEAPHAVALNSGVPTPFPRVNGYALVPTQGGTIVGMVTWLGIERSPIPNRSPGDPTLLELPQPRRKMKLAPIATISSEKSAHKLDRGVSSYPSVGDRVVLPTVEQLRVIVEASGSDRRLGIGTCPAADNANVSVDPNKLFGRHLAVLGNTGSGKSCSVAGLIRWSLEAAKEARKKQGDAGDWIPARFIVLDPNGEYATAFEDFGCTVLRVEAQEHDKADQLEVPVWLWNSHEWAAFVRAAPGVQRPLLQRALRRLRLGTAFKDDPSRLVRNVVASYRLGLSTDKAQPETVLSRFPGPKEFSQRLDAMAASLRHLSSISEGDLALRLLEAAESVEALTGVKRRTGTRQDGSTWERTDAFSVKEVADIEAELDWCLEVAGGIDPVSPVSEDTPLRFEPADLPSVLEELGRQHNRADLLDTLTLRIRMLLADSRMTSVLSPTDVRSLAYYLRTYMGRQDPVTEPVLVLDLSLVPANLIHTIIAVLARVVFEATQRFKLLNSREIPTVLVAEEAHTFITRGMNDENDTPSPAEMCRRVFERIAREGRKFGLGLVVSSQRPFELSPTVLAQCNTFLLHRIVNDADRELVSKLVPDTLGGILSELPSLPQRAAILLGHAAMLPVRVEMRELPLKQRPTSADPRFWETWVGDEIQVADWERVAASWLEEVQPPGADTPPNPPQEVD